MSLPGLYLPVIAVSRSCEPKAWQEAKQSCVGNCANSRLPRRLRLLAMTISHTRRLRLLAMTNSYHVIARPLFTRHCGEPKLRAEGVAGSEAILCWELRQQQIAASPAAPRNDDFSRASPAAPRNDDFSHASPAAPRNDDFSCASPAAPRNDV